MSANNPSIVAVLGASGSGKSTYIKREVLRPKAMRRCLIWDPLEEYDAAPVMPLADAAKWLGAAFPSKPPFAAVIRPGSNDPKQLAARFDLFCRLAFSAGDMLVIVEELRFVTRPSFAPLPWSRLSLQGRHQKLRIVATSQRPAHIDKDFLGNATVVRTGVLNYDDDIRAVASAMRIKPDEIADLKPLQWLEKDKRTGDLRRGVISF